MVGSGSYPGCVQGKMPRISVFFLLIKSKTDEIN